MWLFTEVRLNINKLCRMETLEDGIWVLSWFVSNLVYVVILEDSITLLKNFHLHLHISNVSFTVHLNKIKFFSEWAVWIFLYRFLGSNKRHISFHFFTKPSLIPRFPKSVFFCFYWNVTIKVSLCNCLYRLHVIIIHQFEF